MKHDEFSVNFYTYNSAYNAQKTKILTINCL